MPVSKPKKMCDVRLISAACRVEFETENDHTWLFSLCKPQKCTISHISAVCRIEYELKIKVDYFYS